VQQRISKAQIEPFGDLQQDSL